MKRFASHYVYVPSSGFLKQYVVEVNDKGYIAALYRLEEEIESVIWTPGVIRLIPHNYLSQKINQALTFDNSEITPELSVLYTYPEPLKLVALQLYPFDFSEMKATAGTMIRILNNSGF